MSMQSLETCYRWSAASQLSCLSSKFMNIYTVPFISFFLCLCAADKASFMIIWDEKDYLQKSTAYLFCKEMLTSQ